MNGLKGLKGFKGLTTVGVLLSVMFVFVISVFYVLPALADSDRISSVTVAPTNVTSGQKLPSLNFSFNVGGSGNVTNITINFSQPSNNAGNFTPPVSNNSVICGGVSTSLAGWISRVDGTAVFCANVTALNGVGAVFNISIVNTTVGIYAPAPRGLYQFNISIFVNNTVANMNSSLVGVDVQKITGNGTANVTTAEIGKNQSIKFTIFGGSDTDKSINKIVINFTSAGFVAPVAVSCPGLGNGGNGWGAATIGANDVTCSQGSGSVLGAGASTTIILNGTTAGQTAGIQPFYVGLYDTTTGEFANFTNSTSITVFGLLNVTGTNLAPSTVLINTNSTNNGTNAARFNFSARGEQMNVTMITLLRTGTATVADILEVAIYNGTQNATGGAFVDPSNATLIAKNTSAPDSLGRYVFSGIGFNVSNVTDNFILVVYNVSRSATGGRTVGFMINNTGNVTATGALSAASITPTLVTTASTNATIVGNITITGTDALISRNITIGSANVSVITFNFAPSGEQMNITQVVLTRMGTATDTDVLAVGLYNSSSDGSNVFTANATLIAWNTTPDSLGRYNFTVGFNVSTSGNQLLVVVNLTSGAVGGRTLGFFINGTGNVTTTSAVSGQSITETLVTTSSFNATIFGNLTITGTNTAPSTILINTNGTNNGTQFVRFNLSTRGEGMNVTGITILRTGTATNADILEIALYNATPASASSVDTLTAVQLIAKNTSAPDSLGRYDFSGFRWNISGSADSVDQYLFVVANISRSATGGRTIGFMLNNTGNVTVTSRVSGLTITPAIITGASNNATIVGNLTITGTNATSTLQTIGTKNLSIVTFNFAPSGEQMNVTQINLTMTGTAQVADVLAVGLYNSSSDGSAVFTANATLIAWNSSAPRADGTYNFTGLGFNVTTSGNQLLVVVNLSSSATVGRTLGFTLSPAANVTVTSAVSGLAITSTLVTTSAGNTTLIGNLTITGTDRIGSAVAVSSLNITAISYNFTATGEQMNVTQINLTRIGTVTDADVLAVGLYNGTNTTFNGSSEFLTLIAWNSSAPRADGTYNFTGLGFNVTTTPRGNILLVVVNLTSGATGGRTIGFRLSPNGNITVTGGITNQVISGTLITTSSGNASIYGNLTITGTSQIASSVSVGSRNLTFISYNFSTIGEAMNVTGINLTLTGTVSTADIESVAIYNTTNTTFNLEVGTLIAQNSSAPRADGTYSFSGIGFNISAASRKGNILLVVVNFTAGSVSSGGKTAGFTIKAANVSVTSAVSGIAITPTLVTEASNNATVTGNLTVFTTADISVNVKINSRKVAFVNLTFLARGEQVNVSSINLTLRGNASFANVSEIKLYNDDGSSNGTLDASDTLIAGTVTAPTSSRITITPTSVIALAPSTAKSIFIVINVSDVAHPAGSTLGMQINSTDVAALGNTTAQGISTSWAAFATANRTIQSNIGQQVVGTVTGWYTLNIPSQTIMESIGWTAGTSQNFNISKILQSLRTNYRFVYYNTDGTSSGWKLFDRTDWAGSSLQYANNTNDKVYWVNMTAEDTFEL